MTRWTPAPDWRAQKEEKVARLHALIEAKTAELIAGELADYLRFAARFHRYSFQNALLIWAQDPEATLVKGFRSWNDVGRYVRKGEHGIMVFKPMRVEDKEDPEKTKLLFGTTTVFDVRQTEGQPLPDPPQPLDPTIDPATVEPLYSILVRTIQDDGATVTIVPIEGAARGQYRPRTKAITISNQLDSGTAFKVLLHEAAHFYADHHHEASEDAETVAELASYIAMAHIGIDTSSYTAPYVASWARDTKTLTANAGQAQLIARRLIAILDQEEEALAA